MIRPIHIYRGQARVEMLSRHGKLRTRMGVVEVRRAHVAGYLPLTRLSFWVIGRRYYWRSLFFEAEEVKESHGGCDCSFRRSNGFHNPVQGNIFPK